MSLVCLSVSTCLSSNIFWLYRNCYLCKTTICTNANSCCCCIHTATRRQKQFSHWQFYCYFFIVRLITAAIIFGLTLWRLLKLLTTTGFFCGKLLMFLLLLFSDKYTTCKRCTLLHNCYTYHHTTI